MADDRRAMYDGWSKTGAHSQEWGRIANDFVKQAFAGGARVVKCPCRICRNFAFLFKDDIEIHLCKNGFMPNYLVWREHGEVMPAAESDGNDDEDRMDEMIADIGREYHLDSKE